ncbi:MAG TPA: hypothetical protein V6C69_07945 [Trichormus sp.]
MSDVVTAPAPVKDVSDRAATAKQGDQGWNGGAARDIWGKPPVAGQRTDATATQANDAGKDSQSKAAAADDATSSASDQAAKQADAASDQSVKSTGPKEATTNANDKSRNNNAKDQSQPTLEPQDQGTDKGKDAPQLVAEVPQEAKVSTTQATDSTASSQQKQYSLPDGSTGVSEQTNDATSKHYNLKLSVADNQSIINNAQSAFDSEINRQIAALPGAAMQGIGDGLNSLAQMGVFVGGTVLNELQIVGDIGVTAIDAAVVPSFVAGDLNRLGDDSNALAAKGDAVMDGVGKAWAPVDQDCQRIGGEEDYPGLLIDPVKSALKAYDNYSSQSAPDQVKQIADTTTQIVAPVAGESLLGAASGLVRKEAVGAAATAADGATTTDAVAATAVDVTMGATFKANMTELLDRMKAAISKYTNPESEASDLRAVDPGPDAKARLTGNDRTGEHLNEGEKLRTISDAIKLTVTNDGATEAFASRIQDLVNNLDPHEKMFLEANKTEIIAVRNINDRFPNQSPNTAGLYDVTNNKIYIPERVGRVGNPNPAEAFHLRHEIGHNFNLKRDMNLSEQDAFKAQYNTAYDAMSKADQRKLGLTKTEDEYQKRLADYNRDAATAEAAGRTFLERAPLSPSASKDEVFSDLYAHTTGEPLKTDYSQDIENAFSKDCEGFVQAKIERYINTLKKKAGIQ